jgi:hypothetical protein
VKSLENQPNCSATGRREAGYLVDDVVGRSGEGELVSREHEAHLGSEVEHDWIRVDAKAKGERPLGEEQGLAATSLHSFANVCLASVSSELEPDARAELERRRQLWLVGAELPAYGHAPKPSIDAIRFGAEGVVNAHREPDARTDGREPHAATDGDTRSECRTHTARDSEPHEDF